ncbi:nucleotidyltransferase [Halarcobacter sp.]|uniref:nucleotidyltransferase domain-containing protein n=1 Tax=Halarcobacter sp. TaxID=2321133 RepID=UPI0029F594AA|nr:nucleotidyltransferase [Halarcobacter sp.]
MTNRKESLILEKIVELLELPDSAYEKAKNRYEDLGDWFDRDDSLLSSNDVHIFPQGSFRLGTAIRPLDSEEEYDLDLACNARTGISKGSHTQKELKEIIGIELELYRKSKGIKAEKDEKRRCWRLEYQDSLSFHMDIVPSIPLDESITNLIYEDIHEKFVADTNLARDISSKSLSITDIEKDNYNKIDADWNISNPEGYAIWFESRMHPNQVTLLMEKAQVDKLPTFNQKTVLQRVIQLLKRHRDCMFKDNEDSKPISVIITTLSTHAYNGETELASALKTILRDMDDFISSTIPRVANPTRPEEDFADKWYLPDHKHLKLEENFNLWLMAARRDFASITGNDNGSFDSDFVAEKMSISLTEATKIGIALGLATSEVFANEFNIKKEETAKPWRKS